MKRNRIFSIVALAFILSASASGIYKARAQEKKTYIADKIIAVVGDQMILFSDVVMAEAYYKYDNRIPENDNLSEEERTQILEQMLMMKLLATEARIDSLDVSQVNINSQIDDRQAMLVEQYGSVEKVEKIRSKPMFMVREDMKKQIEEQVLAEQMRGQVVGKVTITPAETKRLVKKLKDDEVPLIPIQYSYSQIVKKAPSNDDTKLAIKERLLDMRARVLKGDNFSALARMYSDDQGSATRGGDMGYQSPKALVAEFSDAMVSLKPCQISNVVETEYGQHIIELIDKKNNKYRCRHILLREKFSLIQLDKAIKQLDSLRDVIINKDNTFKDIAREYSDDADSKNNHGRVLNDEKEMYLGLRSKTDKFYVDELKTDYSHLYNLKVGEMSTAYQTYDERGNLICKLIRLDNIYPEHKANINDDYTIIVDIVINKRKEEVLNTWLEQKIKELYIRIEEPYRSYKFKNQWAK
ncbi:MAG: peptidylprolyl isomerase [Bacteroidetes bacterium]|nr:peptidylprolyl isomerase [Bacteroidota bacterium]